MSSFSIKTHGQAGGQIFSFCEPFCRRYGTLDSVTTATVNERLTDAELVRRFQADIWRYLRFLGCAESEADDLTQETFLAVIRKPFEYRGDAEAAGYLRKVARNQLLMTARRSRRGPTVQELETAESVWSRSVGESTDDFLDALDECLEQLDGRPKQVVMMHYREGESRKSIASSLGMTADGVKTLLRRTRDVLRRCVKRRLGQ